MCHDLYTGLGNHGHLMARVNTVIGVHVLLCPAEGEGKCLDDRHYRERGGGREDSNSPGMKRGAQARQECLKGQDFLRLGIVEIGMFFKGVDQDDKHPQIPKSLGMEDTQHSTGSGPCCKALRVSLQSCMSDMGCGH